MRNPGGGGAGRQALLHGHEGGTGGGETWHRDRGTGTGYIGAGAGAGYIGPCTGAGPWSVAGYAPGRARAVHTIARTLVTSRVPLYASWRSISGGSQSPALSEWLGLRQRM